MYYIRRLTIAAASLGFLVFMLWFLPTVLNPTPPSPDEKRRDKKWIESSPYWLDRQACRWLSLCGVHHLRWDAPALGNHSNEKHDDGRELSVDLKSLELRELFALSDSYKWLSRESTGDESWEIAGRERGMKVDVNVNVDATDSDAPEDDKKMPIGELRKRSAPESTSSKSTDIPKYVLDYAPLVHLFSGENFWPSHIAEHIEHMIPATNNSFIHHKDDPARDIISPNSSHPLTLDNLYQTLNHYSTRVCLTSEVDVETRPEWLHSHNGIPAPFADNGDDDDNLDGSNPHTNPDVRNGHDYEQPDHKFSDDTTWFSVDKDHPLNRISDPRKLPTPQEVMALRKLEGPPEVRAKGPQEARVRQLLHEKAAAAVAASTGAKHHQIVVGDVPQSVLEGEAGETFSAASGTAHGYKPDESGYSKAPAILVMVNKGSGILDAFWFFFYSYNLGQTVLKVRYGNHVGDWEHCMIRFENGVPRALFLSEHAGGQAYAWNALEKYNNKTAVASEPLRPVIYSAVGSHAMYALPGTHPYVLPFKMLRDETDKGPLWDPALNNLAYHYDYVLDREQGGAGEHDPENEDDPVNGDDSDDRKDLSPGGPYVPPTSLTPASSNPDAPTSWFHFRGLWGDELYELGDARQWRLFGQYHYTEGPAGPKFKNLGREKVCQTERCRILYSLDAGKKASWYS